MTASGGGDWSTPLDLFNQLNAEFDFGLDAAANDANHKCERWLGPGGVAPDALVPDAHWGRLAQGKAVWLNPPYGRDVGRWIDKAWWASHHHGVTVVMLLPARTDTKWFHDIVVPLATEIRFLQGRLKFSGAKAGALFPSMVVVFRAPVDGVYQWARWAR